MKLEHRIPPPIIALIAAGLMWLVSLAIPPVAVGREPRLVLALLVLVAGVACGASGMRAFARAGTTVNPLEPSQASRLVTGGIYRYSRNPMYVGQLLVLLAWAIYLGNAAALLILPAFVLYLNRFQIVTEERALARLFGAEYDAYCNTVRRWL